LADNLSITSGSGTTIATDDVSSVHYQRVKLVDGTLDSTAAIPGDATNGLYVNVTKNVPGTGATNLGKAEDGAHTSGDTGVFALSVYRSTPTQAAGTTADYSALITDQNGRLYVNSAIDSSAMSAAGAALTPKFAAIAASSSGNNTLVAAVTSNKIRVLALYLVSAGTTTVKFQSAAGGTDLTGASALVANTGFVLPYNPVGWFQTVSGELLNLVLSGAISVAGGLTYVEIP